MSPSYDTLDVHPHRRLTEASLCHQPPYGRSLQQSKSRCVRSSAAYSYLLAFHILLLCAAGRNPAEIAAFLLCARSSVYRIVPAYRTGSLGIRIDQEGQRSIAVQSAICRCFRAVDRLPSHRGSDTPSGVRGAMITQVLHCPYTYCMSRRNFLGGIHLRVR